MAIFLIARGNKNRKGYRFHCGPRKEGIWDASFEWISQLPYRKRFVYFFFANLLIILSIQKLRKKSAISANTSRIKPTITSSLRILIYFFDYKIFACSPQCIFIPRNGKTSALPARASGKCREGEIPCSLLRCKSDVPLLAAMQI